MSRLASLESCYGIMLHVQTAIDQLDREVATRRRGIRIEHGSELRPVRVLRILLQKPRNAYEVPIVRISTEIAELIQASETSRSDERVAVACVVGRMKSLATST